MKTIVFVLFAVLILFGSCTKRPYVEGYVFEKDTGVPVFNCYVRMNRYSKPISNSPYRSATTDSRGYFKIYYNEGAFDYSFYLDVISGEHVSKFEMPVKNKDDITVFLPAYAYVKIRVKNNSSQQASVSASTQLVDPHKYNSGDYFTVPAFGDAVSKTTMYTNVNEKREIRWTVYKAGVNSGNFSDSVYISNKFDTLVYLIQVN